MHVEKYEKTAVGHLLKHYDRTAEHIGNREVDRSKSSLNYNLCEREQGAFAYYQKRLSEVKCQNRKDVKTLCDWVITLPQKPFTERGEREFFKVAYKELCRRYGSDNITSAWVHRDEKGQPHLHFCFIPVVLDKKKNILKVSAKEALNKAELCTIHKDMEKVMEATFKRDVGILNGATKNGNKTITELKTEELKKEVKSLNDIKRGLISDLAEMIRKSPRLLTSITRAVRLALGDRPIERQLEERNRERSR